MKNSFIRIALPILFCFVLTNNVYAQFDPCSIPGSRGCNDGGEIPNPGNDPDPTGDSTGYRGTPIDDYLPILIISAVAIAGLYSYKERKIIKK